MKKLNIKSIAKAVASAKAERVWMTDEETQALVAEAHSGGVSVHQLITYLQGENDDGKARYDGLLLPWAKAYAFEKTL